jgi:hypothetical protein
MQMIAFLTDQLSIRRILDHLGLSRLEQDKPPTAREILRVAEQGDGWGMPAKLGLSETARCRSLVPSHGTALPATARQ